MTTTLGCFSRLWANWGLEVAIRGAAAAGYECFGLMRINRAIVVGEDTAPEEAEAVGARIRAAGLKLVSSIAPMAWDVDQEETVARFNRMMDNVKRAGGKGLLVCGTDEARRERFYDLMRRASDHAGETGMTIALKPHGGISATAADCARAGRGGPRGVQDMVRPGQYHLLHGPGPC